MTDGGQSCGLEPFCGLSTKSYKVEPTPTRKQKTPVMTANTLKKLFIYPCKLFLEPWKTRRSRIPGQAKVVWDAARAAVRPMKISEGDTRKIILVSHKR